MSLKLAPMSSLYPDLTQKQEYLLEFLLAFTAEHGWPPTIREICLNFGFRSPNAAHGHLKALQRKKYIGMGGGSRRISFRKGKIIGPVIRVVGGNVLVNAMPAAMHRDLALKVGQAIVDAAMQAGATAEEEPKEKD